jgi:hypothetical protein
MLNFYKLHSDPNQLNGYKDAHLKIPEIAWEVADTNEKKQELEHLWIHDPRYAYEYAYDIVRGKWSPGEKVITSDPRYAYEYAYYVIKKPWEPGEKAISSDPAYAYMYACYVLRKPWPSGEKAIASDPDWKQEYENHFKLNFSNA